MIEKKKPIFLRFGGSTIKQSLRLFGRRCHIGWMPSPEIVDPIGAVTGWSSSVMDADDFVAKE